MIRMVEKTYEKRLTATEAKRHYVYIESDAASKIFPPMGKPFKLRIGKEEFEVKMDDHFRILAAVFRDHIDFTEGNVFVFKKASDGSFTLNVKK